MFNHVSTSTSGSTWYRTPVTQKYFTDTGQWHGIINKMAKEEAVALPRELPLTRAKEYYPAARKLRTSVVNSDAGRCHGTNASARSALAVI